MPAGIDSPGFVEEEKEKPAVTKKIEESDEQISAEKCAEYLIAGAFSFLSPFLLLCFFGLLVSSLLFLPPFTLSPSTLSPSTLSPFIVRFRSTITLVIWSLPVQLGLY